MTTLFRELADADEPRALTRGLWARRALMVLLAVVALAALLDVFGQGTSRTAVAGDAATLALRAPETVRGGLLFQSTIEIAARRDIEHPRLVLDRGWTDGMQFNSTSPDAESQAPRGDRLVLSYAALAAGDQMTIRLQFQVDPTSVGRRPYDVELDDAETPIARVDRTITTLP